MTHSKSLLSSCLVCCALFVVACQPEPAKDARPHQEFIELTRELSTDAMAGRAPGTDGNAAARAYLLERISAMGLAPLSSPDVKVSDPAPSKEHLFSVEYTHTFARARRVKSRDLDRLPDGVNILFEIPGTSVDARTIVITAHYDHLGVIEGKIYNGADDNASGVAGALAIAQHFLESPPDNRIVFALLDAEEFGLAGARAFVRDFAEALDINLNLNLDMISRSDVNELYLAGTYHQPHWVPFFEDLADRVPVRLLLGYDNPANGPAEDWTQQSDHFAFHEKGIPFVYFGVEDHPDYHQPTDTFDRIPLAFFSNSIETVVIAAESIDASLDVLLQPEG